MSIYKAIISYDGTNYKGWQVQPHASTVCSTLQKCFYKTFKHKAIILGASRTDSGVHSLGQTIRIRTNLQIDPKRLLKAWNDSLPSDIFIRSLEKVSDNFHPMIDVYYKIYLYNLFLEKPLPFISRYGWYYEFINHVDLEKFNKILQLYVGTHDFRSFCKLDPKENPNDEDKNTIRTIDLIKIKKLPQYKCLQITVKGKSFLRFQIRRMIGYALDVARRKNLSVNYIKGLLDNPNSKQTLVKAKGQGLILRKIVYKSKETFNDNDLEK